jgi:hypothetical protein
MTLSALAGATRSGLSTSRRRVAAGTSIALRQSKTPVSRSRAPVRPGLYFGHDLLIAATCACVRRSLRGRPFFQSACSVNSLNGGDAA